MRTLVNCDLSHNIGVVHGSIRQKPVPTYWERVAGAAAQSASVASGGRRPGVGSVEWMRDAAAMAPALPQRCFLAEWNQELEQFGLQLLREFENELGRAVGGHGGSGGRSETSETHESHETPMVKLDFNMHKMHLLPTLRKTSIKLR